MAAEACADDEETGADAEGTAEEADGAETTDVPAAVQPDKKRESVQKTPTSF
jgi:hypothetical protein